MRRKGNAPATFAEQSAEAFERGTNHRTHCTTSGMRSSSFVAGATPLLRPVGSLLIAMAAAISFLPMGALADEPEREPEAVILWIAEDESTPVPVPSPASAPLRVDVSESDATILARLLWSSPLTNEDDKRKLCWLVFNRVDDESSLFGATVESVVIRREFPFYDGKAYLSETNLRIAREELRRWALHLIGAVKERYLDADYLYAAFNGHTVTFKKTIR